MIFWFLLVPGSGSGPCLPSLLSFLFAGMGRPMSSLLHMNVVETWFVAGWVYAGVIFWTVGAPLLPKNLPGSEFSSHSHHLRLDFISAGGLLFLPRHQESPSRLVHERLCPAADVHRGGILQCFHASTAGAGCFWHLEPAKRETLAESARLGCPRMLLGMG